MVSLRPYQLSAIQEAIDALKKNDDPVLLECSVGGGKSYLIASIAKKLDDLNKRVLCLVNSSELVRNNSEAYKDFNGNPSVFCASLSHKSINQNVIFATPQSVIRALKTNHPIADIIFNLIIIDEAHSINFKSDQSTLMQILRHYKQAYNPMRTLGLTGTSFRGSESIVGKNALFKTQVGNISTQYLIENGYLVKPQFGINKVEGFDFSKCKIQNSGEFKGSELQAVINSKKRLTWEILQEAQVVMADRNCVMIFCSTKPHCYEAMAALPAEQTRIILGDTSDHDRNEALTLARQKKIKWLISVNCLLTGVNIPALNGIIWLRPTSSLLLFIQGIGRGLRLYEGKTDCLILDYAQNLDRFQDIDHPIINEALQTRRDDEEEDKPFTCYTCSTPASINTRRCTGMVGGKRCEYYFQFKDCVSCCVPNDITARRCRSCNAELIDPNAKLTRHKPDTYTLKVIKAEYSVIPQGNTSFPTIKSKYFCAGAMVYEGHCTNSKKSQNIFYAKWLRLHLDKASEYYMHLTNINKMKKMIEEPLLKTPTELICTKNEHGFYTIIKKVFN